MIDSIFVALSGMLGHQRGLNVISQNVANMNTPGFRGSVIGFSDVFNGTSASNGQQSSQSGRGGGVDASRTLLDMRRGEQQATGRDLDLFLKGDGFFIVQDEEGEIRYTRNGRFEFDGTQLVLVAGNRKLKVMSRNADGSFEPMTIEGQERFEPKPTTEVVFDRNLSSNDNNHVIEPVTVIDSLGISHTLRVVFDRSTASTQVQWKVTVQEDGIDIGTTDLLFAGVFVDRAPVVSLSLKGVPRTDIVFNIEALEGVSTGDSSTAVFKSQDGVALGALTGQSFDINGVLKLAYSNGKTADGQKLALAEIRDDRGLVELGGGLFSYKGKQPVNVREAGEDLQVQNQSLELANVDLTQQFSELILMQRAYQASSQVLSTANDMLEQLMQMRSGK